MTLDSSIRLSPNALTVLEKRHLKKDRSGRVCETPEEMFRRVARAIAEAERAYDPNIDVEAMAKDFYKLMAGLDFLPNSPTLMNAGTEIGQLSACFVLPIEDSLKSIFDAVKATAFIHQSGGGTGYSFSRLRPRGDIVGSTGGIASGPISFMRVFDTATDVIKQGGRRRGANMGILRVDHPDVLDFITCKEKEGAFANFNISVAITDEFMRALEEDGEYELRNPRTGEVVKKLRAREVFENIVDEAWRNGEPGVVFIDRINEFNPTPKLGEIESTNPCGEQPLLPLESCNLGSINLSKMLTPESRIDWAKLERTVKLATRFLDNVITVNKFPLPEIEEATLKTRKIGLGVMGFADMLIALGIPYDSEEAEALASKIMEAINYWSKEASVELAKERGSFPAFEGSIYAQGKLPIPMTNDQIPMTKVQSATCNPQFDWNDLIERIRKHGIRNATTTTIAPTGSIGIIAGASGGIEPIFALAYTRRHVLDEDVLPEVNPLFEKVAKERGFYSRELMTKIAEKGSCQGLSEVPEDVQRVFVTAHDISPEWHVRMQAAFQRWVCASIAKTINMPNEASREDVREAILLAYKLGCKGVTVYRDRSRQEQVLTKGAAEAARPPAVVRPRPQALSGVTYRIPTPLGTAFITVNENGVGQPFEVFANVGKAGSDTAAVAEAMGRLISLCLRLPSPLSPRERMQEVVDQLVGIGGGRPLGFGPNRVRSLPDAIAQVLARHLGLIEKKPIPAQLELPLAGIGDLCPECGQATFVEEEGCRRCYSCGFTVC
jgi:ribonucleoside-diphosphate reductase alpha chain